MFKGAKMISTERGETFLEYTTILSSPCLGISILQKRRMYVNNFEKNKQTNKQTLFLLVKLVGFVITAQLSFNTLFSGKKNIPLLW